MSEMIELLQIPMWLLASIVALKFTKLVREVNAWKILALGFALGFLRVVWKFPSLYETNLDYQILRFIIGGAAAVIIAYGFFENYIETTGISMTTLTFKKTVFLTLIGMVITFLVLEVSGLEESVVSPFRLAEQAIWASTMLASLMLILKTADILKNEPINMGFKVLSIPIGMLGLYYSLATYRRIYKIAGISLPEGLHEFAELIEGLSGFVLAGALLYIYNKSTTQQISDAEMEDLTAGPNLSEEILDL